MVVMEDGALRQTWRLVSGLTHGLGCGYRMRVFVTYS